MNPKILELYEELVQLEDDINKYTQELFEYRQTWELFPSMRSMLNHSIENRKWILNYYHQEYDRINAILSEM